MFKIVKYWQRNPSVDADEFLKRITPAGKRSRLAPFWNDITKLRQHGCTLEQVCQFLATNQVQMSIAGLSKYIKRRDEKEQASAQKPATTKPQPSQATPERPAKEAHSRITNPADVRKASRREINLEDYENDKE
jgi:hypothetical protein